MLARDRRRRQRRNRDLGRPRGGPASPLAGRYRIERELGKGGMGRVLVVHAPDDAPLARRQLFQAANEDCDQAEFAREELQALQSR